MAVPLSTGVMLLAVWLSRVRPPKLRLTWGVPPAMVDSAVLPRLPSMSKSALAKVSGWLPLRLMRLSLAW